MTAVVAVRIKKLPAILISRFFLVTYLIGCMLNLLFFFVLDLRYDVQNISKFGVQPVKMPF